MVKLSLLTTALFQKLFPPDKHFEPGDLLRTEYGDDLPFCAGASEKFLERIRRAALKVSDGDIETLQHAIELAKKDRRDLLADANFAIR